MNDETDLQVYKLVLLNRYLKNHRILSSLKYQLPQRQVSNQPFCSGSLRLMAVENKVTFSKTVYIFI